MDSYEAKRNHRNTWNNTVRVAGSGGTVLSMNLALCSDSCTLTLDEKKYHVVHKLGSRTWKLRNESGEDLMSAVKPSVWNSRIDIESANTNVILTTTKPWSCNSIVRNRNGDTLVSLFRESWSTFNLRIEVARSEEMPPLLFAFCYGMFVLQYRRRSSNWSFGLVLPVYFVVVLLWLKPRFLTSVLKTH